MSITRTTYTAYCHYDISVFEGLKAPRIKCPWIVFSCFRHTCFLVSHLGRQLRLRKAVRQKREKKDSQPQRNTCSSNHRSAHIFHATIRLRGRPLKTRASKNQGYEPREDIHFSTHFHRIQAATSAHQMHFGIAQWNRGDKR